MKLRRFPSGRRPKARLWVLFLSSTFAVSLCFPFSPFLSSPALLPFSSFPFFSSFSCPFTPSSHLLSLLFFSALFLFPCSLHSPLAFFSSFFPVLFAFLLSPFSLPFSFLKIPKLALCLRLPDAVREKKRTTANVGSGSAGRKALTFKPPSPPRIKRAPP